jgi:2-haloacid dehalogenase
MTDVDLGAFDVLTFDCYGTLIDWERGILAALAPVLAAHGVEAADDTLLEAYAEHETELEAGPYLPYREVLGRALERVAQDLGFEPSTGEVDAFAASVGEWPAFPDSPGALARLQERYRLAVITNCDDDLFAASNRRLGVTFDWVVTAEQARSYKPHANNFEVAFAKIGAPPERILHVAQSLFHDHVTAKRLGLSTVWIDRRRGRAGSGATPPAEARPDLAFHDLASFAAVAVDAP